MRARSAVADNFYMGKTLRIGIAALALAALAPSTTSLAANGTTCWTSTKSELGFASKMNNSRSARDLGSMRLDPELSRVARVHTREMLRSKSLFHTPMTKLTRRVTNWVTIGENVGEGETVRSLHRAFMASPTHRLNILDKTFNHVGVGTARAGGKLWVTVVFEARTDPGTTLAMPRC
ncbi:MAG TPA: CAP domain-containing protein [Actinomycetota bacterium]|nr:CAP domain-containing protein [Actinomycetota bacterium]